MTHEHLEYKLMQQHRQQLMHEAQQSRLVGQSAKTGLQLGWLRRLTSMIGLFL